MIVLIDNYDSFTWNLHQLLASVAGSSASVSVFRNDACPVGDVVALRPSHVVLSPGPGHPATSGLSLELPRHLVATPLLGVCLGHQALALCFGGRVTRSPRPRHGSTVSVNHDASELFSGVPPGFPAALYHSLAVDKNSLPPELRVSAWTSEGDIMGIRHVRQPLFGIQFHPESFMTPSGAHIITTFLAMR